MFCFTPVLQELKLATCQRLQVTVMVIIYVITMMLLTESVRHSPGLGVWVMETVSWI